MSDVEPSFLRDVPYMGVIWVVHEASKLGFVNGHPDWCNLGQGQPEVGPMEGAPPRIESVALQPADHAYGPLGGLDEMRDAVAAHTNRLHRRGLASQYARRNVAVAQGGRLALSRALAALGAVNVGYQLPDYTAYEDMLDLHLARVTPIPLRAPESNGFAITPAQFEQAVEEQGLTALLLSNPCNPTGRVLQGAELEAMVRIARERRVLLLMDEFYSHFIYKPGRDGAWGPGDGPVSACAFVQDVERDPVLVFDGLTKCFRYPGWRVGWIAGPSALVETVARVASSMDGGPSRIAQRAALQALQPAAADQETTALRRVFAKKRNIMVSALRELGVTFAREPESTFYAWGKLSALPEPLNDSMAFFRRAIERKVMTVPGEFFDVNPGKRRQAPSPYRQWMRFSFGPPEDNLRMGLERLKEMVKSAR
ncbi:MAG TPA: pyridoxal phosphate-dependent aminotransferase [Planctomycetota bacterium]|nr:pyridoxal phosphate-dependent aminotransferase [Planctomycetota bacterium]